MATFVLMLMICIMDMLVDMLFAIVSVGMLMFIVCVTAHFSFTSKSNFPGSFSVANTIDQFNYKIISFY
ncbi:MAG: hypothetical protein JW999_07240 [Methanotrichaceae archaeon]|mgnify:CR=1 FL=1|nr:hypothetical protein [Methanotrichaceae archaeon]